MMVNWSKARSSVVGLPAVPQRATIVFDEPSIDRVNGPVQTPLWLEPGGLADQSAERAGISREEALEQAAAKIPLGRMEAMPYVEYCVTCQGQKDAPNGGPTRRKLTDYT